MFHGNYEWLFNLPTAVEAITAKDLQRLAGEVLYEDNMTVGILVAPDDEQSE